MTLWNDVLDNWSKGGVLKYPPQLNGKFLWNTSVITNNGDCPYKHKFKTDIRLPRNQCTDDYKEYIQKSRNSYVTSFPNLSGDTMLVIPMPVKSKNFATLKDFIDNSSEIHQQFFWKKVSTVIRNFMKKHQSIWVSVHGLGVPYTHIRISSSPKYYFDNSLSES